MLLRPSAPHEIKMSENDVMMIDIPRILDWDWLRRGPFPSGGWDWDGTREVVFTGGHPPTHVEPIALAALAAWVMSARRKGRVVGVSEAIQSPYTWKVGLLRALQGTTPPVEEARGTPDYVPVSQVMGARRVEQLGGLVRATLHVEEPEAGAELVNAVSEVVRNAEEHADSACPTSFVAGYFRSQRRVTFAVGDTGKGILRTLRRKGVCTLEDDDGTAVEKALQPHITGAGVRGEPTAPFNAGMGLATTRRIAQECAGKMILWSGSAAFQAEGATSGSISEASDWRGTLVMVTIRPDQVGAHSLRPAAIGLTNAGSLRRTSRPPDGALVVQPPIDGARFAANKTWYKEQQPLVLEAVASGRAVHVDFRRAVYSTQSALHALFFEPIRIHGDRALQLITVEGGDTPLLAALNLVVGYALLAQQRFQEEQIPVSTDGPALLDPDGTGNTSSEATSPKG